MRDSITIDQFCPIVLGNFLFKISSKILADRLALIAARIVSPQQFGFIRGGTLRIVLLSHLIVLMCCYGGNVAMKIDICKAFDTLDWKFLCRVLMAFGFSQTFIDWIVSILGSSKLSVLINGSPAGYFGCSRGVRQGDRLSPFLFGIAEDFLSRLLSRMVALDQFLHISSPRGFSAPTHLLYADDVLIFCRGTVRNLRRVVHAFRVYGSISGQLVNWSKSSIFFGSSVSPAWISSLRSLVGMQIGQLPFSYLGVPLFQGKPRKSVLMPIADKILSKFAKWKGKSLSLAGRATLICSVITGSFVHSFMVWIPNFLAMHIHPRVSDFIRDGRWILDDRFGAQFLDLCFGICRIAISPMTDYLVWPHSREGSVSCKAAYSRMFHDIPQLFRRQFSPHFRGVSPLTLGVLFSSRPWIGCMRNCVDDLLILHRFGLSGRPGKAPVIRSVVSSPPPPGG
ncbi:hypothetical protein Dsin_029109 [Dipteronia sinensis]|uniref:Reverse transcriptase domain-containing protein n=1 Tax=Dipteronia sinensis TaxID=43782 RepID=A0AAE0DUV7_9ROSI|nr:hypothetical protein Dsin_029109 [Dipteronia sinensis]